MSLPKSYADCHDLLMTFNPLKCLIAVLFSHKFYTKSWYRAIKVTILSFNSQLKLCHRHPYQWYMKRLSELQGGGK